jgi:NACalpha-BTF3-like transcription factor
MFRTNDEDDTNDADDTDDTDVVNINEHGQHSIRIGSDAVSPMRIVVDHDGIYDDEDDAPPNEQLEIPVQDIVLVMNQARCTKDEAIKAINDNDMDIVRAIIDLANPD